MLQEIAASFVELWRYQPPFWQAVIFAVAILAGALTFGTFWMLVDLVIADVWPRIRGVRVRWAMNSALAEQARARRIAEEKRNQFQLLERHRLELNAIVSERFQR